MSAAKLLEAPEQTTAASEDFDECLCGIPHCQGHEVIEREGVQYAILYNHPDSPRPVAQTPLPEAKLTTVYWAPNTGDEKE